MVKEYQLTFYKANFIQYQTILSNEDIQNKIAEFILKYVSIEAFYKKLLIAEKERNGKTLTNEEKKRLDVKSGKVLEVLRFFDIKVDKDLVERIFGSNNKNYMECSIKKLRDRLVHNVNENVLRVILERYDDIMSDIDEFISKIK